MKALHFARPFEYRLDIPQDRITQGSLVRGTLTVVNRDSVARTGLRLALALAQGGFGEIKAKGVEGLDVIEKHPLAEDFALAPGAERTEPWSVTLRQDCWATGKDGGMFLIYGGNLEAAAERGFIDVPVGLAPPIETFIQTVENHFAFEARSRKHSGGYAQVRFKPPAKYPTLEEFSAALRIGEDGLSLRFACKTKGLARGKDTGIRTRKLEAERHLAAGEYLTAAGLPNRDLYRRVIHEVLEEMTPGALYTATGAPGGA
jgi:hypothetical protein